MNKDTAKDYLPLVQALGDGEVIQYKYQKCDHSYGWMDLESVMDFCMPAEFYRIKPKPREIWANRYPGSPDVFHDSKEQALMGAAHGAVQVCYREVIE